MASRDEIVYFLDDYLAVDEIHDVSLNGLQVEGRGEVKKIGFAVDACLDVFNKARELSCDMVIVHHGIFWDKDDPRAIGMMGARVKALMDVGISLYGCHVPIDIHPKSGNNAQIAGKLGLSKLEPFSEYHGVPIGFIGKLDRELSKDEFLSLVGAKVGKVVVSHMFGNAKIKSVAIISGAASFGVRDAHAWGADVYVSGEPAHEVFNQTKELQMNAVYLGHYFSETFGVKALSDVLSRKFKGVECVFIDNPTGL